MVWDWERRIGGRWGAWTGWDEREGIGWGMEKVIQAGGMEGVVMNYRKR